MLPQDLGTLGTWPAPFPGHWSFMTLSCLSLQSHFTLFSCTHTLYCNLCTVFLRVCTSVHVIYLSGTPPHLFIPSLCSTLPPSSPHLILPAFWIYQEYPPIGNPKTELDVSAFCMCCWSPYRRDTVGLFVSSILSIV